MKNPGPARLSNELEFAVALVREAGELILSYFRNEMQVRHKGKDNPVTAADLEADRMLREGVARAFPEDGWLSEETVDSEERLSRNRIWVVDPLDGTREFVRGLPEFAISLARVEAGAPQLSVIYNPARNDLFTAERGQGAYRNGTRIRISSRGELSGSHILGSRSENTRQAFKQLASCAKLECVGSIAYKLALVAAGAADLTISVRPKNEWDVCAGSLLMAEAGGTLTDLRGNELVFNRPNPRVHGIIAANPVLHSAALKWICDRPALFDDLK